MNPVNPAASSADADSSLPTPVTPDPWQAWRAATPARLALGRAGAGMPTDETLRFGWAHAMTRDAIHAPLDIEALENALRADGWATEQVQSRAADRTTYLRRPDLGRQLDPAAAARLRESAPAGGTDLSITLGDGLSSLAVARHAVAVLAALKPHLPRSTRFAPVIIAQQARVALADEVGEAFAARLAVILIGERPGLSSPDSLGIYLTLAPKRGRHDAERNCISNVRPEGLGYGAAAFKLAWLMREALRLGQTGIGLKDQSDRDVLPAAPDPTLPAGAGESA